MSATEVREEVLSWIKNINTCAMPGSGERGTVTGLMNSSLRLGGSWEESNVRRRQVLAWIFRDLLGKPMAGGISAKELSDEMWWALVKWTDAHKDQDTGVWRAHDGFENEMVECLRAMENWEHDMNNQLGFLEDI